MKLRADHKIAARHRGPRDRRSDGRGCLGRSRAPTTLAEHLGAAGGVPARIGSVDADLTGTVRLSDVALGELDRRRSQSRPRSRSTRCSTVSSRADEIRVAGPHLAIAVDRDGDSDLARLVRKLAHGGPAHGAARSRHAFAGSSSARAR